MLCWFLLYINISAMGIHMSPLSWTSLPPPTPSHPSRLSQSSRLSSLHHISKSHWLSVLHVVMYMFQRRQWQSTPVLLPGKFYGWRSVVGCSPWGRSESDTTERLHFHFHALEKEMATHSSCSCLENPRHRGTWWAAVYGVAQVGDNGSDLAAAAVYMFECYSLSLPHPIFPCCVLQSVHFALSLSYAK